MDPKQLLLKETIENYWKPVEGQAFDISILITMLMSLIEGVLGNCGGAAARDLHSSALNYDRWHYFFTRAIVNREASRVVRANWGNRRQTGFNEVKQNLINTMLQKARNTPAHLFHHQVEMFRNPER